MDFRGYSHNESAKIRVYRMMQKEFSRRIRNDFIAGLVVVLPVTITFIILNFLIVKLNLFILNPAIKAFHFNNPLFIFLVKITLLLCLILLIMVVGSATRIVLAKKIFAFLERLVSKVPIANKIHTTVKELFCGFLGQSQGVFRKVVLVEYPRKGIFAIGFVTSEGEGEVQVKTEETVISIFLPTTPNPTSGMLILVPKEQVIPLDMSIEDGLKMIISGGIVSPTYGNRKDRGDSFKKI